MIPDLVNGSHLPLGRWPAEVAELEQFRDRPDATARKAIWDDWQNLTQALRQAVGEVASCWLAGSYFTSKEVPGDIDCVYLVRRDRLVDAKQDPVKDRFLGLLASPGASAAFGLQVDAFILAWWPRPGAKPGSAQRSQEYLAARGYWDDLWSRERDTANLPLDKLPRRGYLEVVLDGYQ